MDKFSKVTAPAGSRWLHAGVVMQKGPYYNEQEFRTVRWSHAYPHNTNRTQVDGQGSHRMHPLGVGEILRGHPEVKRLKKEGWKVAEKGSTLSLNKQDVVDGFKEHEKYASTMQKKGVKYVEHHKGETTYDSAVQK